MRALLPALERFVRFEGPDPARSRSHWRPCSTSRSRSRHRSRCRLGELANWSWPTACEPVTRASPGWVTTMPTDVGAAADLAQAVAVPQRWWASAGNFVDDLAMRWLIALLGLPGELCRHVHRRRFDRESDRPGRRAAACRRALGVASLARRQRRAGGTARLLLYRRPITSSAAPWGCWAWDAEACARSRSIGTGTIDLDRLQARARCGRGGRAHAGRHRGLRR